MAIADSIDPSTSKREEISLLTPGQQKALGLLQAVVRATPLTVLEGEVGVGKTTVLKQLQSLMGARYLSLREMLDSIAVRHPHAVEESVRGLLEEAFQHAAIVILDDLDYLATVTRMTAAFPRPYLLEAVIKSAFADVVARGQKLVLAQRSIDRSYAVTSEQPVRVGLQGFNANDYAVVLAMELGQEKLDGLDVQKVFRFSSRLSGYQISAVCRLLIQKGQTLPTTDEVIACINEHILTSNTNVAEVAPVAFSDLKGAEDLIEKLERTILLPMQDTARADKLGLKAKRGVLLHGQPGTGKTSIGRALAHQMRGKFFLIDGTFISEPPNKFFAKIRQVFEDAKANSPSVIFIDDADVLFKTDHVYGLNRYLLTMLDGLESESIGDVCVMMTAMNVADMPVALLRSGRVEVWLETKLPNADVRREILEHYTRNLAAEHQTIDMQRMVKLTGGFTPADLRRIVSDAKAYVAYNESKNRAVQPFGDYLVKAAQELRELKGKLASALGQPLPESGDLDAVSNCCG